MKRHKATPTKFIITILFITCFNSLHSQEDFNRLGEGTHIFSASFQYKELPGEWSINYLGISLESYLGEKVSVSGSVFYGAGSDSISYIHFPIGGLIILSVLTGSVRSLLFSPDPILWKLLYTENVHYNIQIGEDMIISPSVSLLGFNAGFYNFSESQEPDVILTNGIGLNFKALPSERTVISTNVSLKHFLKSNNLSSEFNDQLGFTVNFQMGIVL